jgi:cyclin D5
MQALFRLWQGHVYSCYSAMVQEDRSSMHSAGVASSGVSVAAHVGSPDASAGTAPPATPDNNNKRRRLRSPQRQ